MLIEFNQVTDEPCSINPELVASTKPVELDDEDDDIDYETGTLIELATGSIYVVTDDHETVLLTLTEAMA